jgi:hypothetical protein
MRWRVLVLSIVSAALFGCVTAREGVDFASLSRTNGALKGGQGRIVVLREAGYGGLFDFGYAITLDGEPMGELKTGTFLYKDRPAGPHQLSVDESGFPGITRKDISVAPGRTYFFFVQPSERSKALQAGQVAGGLVGLVVTAAVTSQVDNPGPVDFVALDDAAGRQAIADSRLIR